MFAQQSVRICRVAGVELGKHLGMGCFGVLSGDRGVIWWHAIDAVVWVVEVRSISQPWDF